MASKSAILAVRIVGDAVDGTKAIGDTEAATGRLEGKLGAAGKIALGIGAALGAAAIAGGKALFDIGQQWTDVENTIRVGTGATGDALDSLYDSAKNVAGAIPAALEDIGPVIADVNTRMGLTGDTLDTVASQYLEAGRILGEDIDIGQTSAAFAAFGIEGEAVVDAMDDLFRVSQATGVGMNDLAGQVQSAGPALQALGFGFEDAIALTGSLDKAGMDASRTMSSMQRGLATLAKTGEEPAAAFQRVVDEIDSFIQAGDTAGAIDTAAQIFGTRGASQFVGAVQSGTIAVDDLMAATGATEDTILGLGQETMTAAEKWQILKNKALVALEPIGKAVFDGAGAAIDWLSGIVENIDFSAITDGFGEIIGGFKAFISAFQAGDGEITSAGFPGFMERAAGIARGALDTIGPPIQAVAGWVTGTLIPAAQQLAGQFATHWAAVADAVGRGVEQIWVWLEPMIPTIQGIATTVGEIITGAVEIITELVGQVSEFILAAWEVIGPPIIAAVTTTWESIIGIIGPAIDTVKAVIDTVMAALRGDWSGVWTGIQGIVDGVWRTIKGIVSGAVNIVKSTVSGAIETIQGVWSRGWSNVKTFFSDTWANIKTAASTGIGDLVGWFRELPGRIMDAIRGVTTRAKSMGRDIIRGMIDGVTSMATRLINRVKNVIDDAIGAAKRLLGIASPSKVFRQLGQWTGQGLADGIAGTTRVVSRAGRDLAQAAIPDRIPAALPGAGAAGRSLRSGGSAPLIEINVDGALDPRAVARQIREILTGDARLRGVIAQGEVILS